MSDRDDPARDDRKSPVRLPGLVVWEDERTGVEKVLDRIRKLLGGGGSEAQEADADAAETRAPLRPMPLPDLPVARDEVERRHEAEVDGEPARNSTSDPLQRATLQMLPGRLEPVNPRIVRQELRFVRASGPEQVVTLGSAGAEPPGHVQIDHASVQRFHARMRFADGEWTIESLAEVDPVRLNREPIDPKTGPHPLSDGDMVRLGRAEFVFHIS